MDGMRHAQSLSIFIVLPRLVSFTSFDISGNNYLPKSHPRSNNRPKIPHRVVHRSDCGSVLRVSQLGHYERRTPMVYHDAKAENKSSSNKHSDCIVVITESVSLPISVPQGDSLLSPSILAL